LKNESKNWTTGCERFFVIENGAEFAVCAEVASTVIDAFFRTLFWPIGDRHNHERFGVTLRGIEDQSHRTRKVRNYDNVFKNSHIQPCRGKGEYP
jgi:hypothetical protein